ncbi:MAG: ABC transporter substrate-binding protein [Rhodospirillales bacterium]|nr:MAG: ABC transporter substrate-binding protein [Rhodospirillales bacterium]
MRELNEYQQMLAAGKLTRRRFMQLATALGASTALATSMAGSALAATPKKGGTLRLGIGHGSTTDSLDPGTFENLYMQTVGGAVYNKLTEVAASGDIVPELAESWDVTPDAATWTFKLRQGVEFHNGKTMDSGDVIASINHHLGEDSKSAAKAILDPIAEVTADGKDTVVFKLKTGNADFPFILSDYHVAILPAKDGKLDPMSGVGNGGYMVESYEPGVRTALKRHPNYWKSDRAHFDGAEVLAILDVAARTNALTTGEIDAMDRVDLKTAHLLKRNRNIRIEEVSGTQHYTFAMRTDTDPFTDNHVRLALKYAIDREALVKTILRGHGVVGNDHPIGRSNRFHADDLEQRQYDPDKAKFHLKEAGLSSLKVDLSAADAAFPGAVDAAVLYKEHAAKAGIDINVVREPNDGYWSNVWLKKPWCAVYWGGRPTEDWMFSTAYAAGVPWNDTYWTHERFNQVLVQARAELDEAKRRQMYFELQKIVSDEGGVVVPMFANYVMGISTKLQHDKLGANWSMDGFRAIERWWFA